MRRLRYRVDMDGVLTDFFGSVFDRYFEATGVRYTPDDLKAHEISSLVGKEEYFNRVEPIYNKPGFFADLKPYPGAIETMREVIAEGHSVEIVTAPTLIYHPIAKRRVINGRVAAEKIDWLARHLPEVAERNVTITKDKTNVDGDVFVEDSAHNFVPWAQAHPKGLVYVVARPWNEKDVLPKNAVRGPLAELQGAVLLYADDEVADEVA